MSYGSSEWQPWVLNEADSLPLLEHAYKSGINTWDTADIYSHGESERIVGKALKQFKIPRNKVVILSKCYFGVDESNLGRPIAESMTNDGELVNQVGLSRKHIFDAVERSVERLGTYIDVLQIHRLDRSTPREEIMKALNDVIEKGWVRYIGASSMAAWEFQTLQNIAEKHGWHKFVSMQNYYNLIYREEEREMVCPAFPTFRLPLTRSSDPILSRHRRRSHPMVSHRTRCPDTAMGRSILQARRNRQVCPGPRLRARICDRQEDHRACRGDCEEEQCEHGVYSYSLVHQEGRVPHYWHQQQGAHRRGGTKREFQAER